MSNLSPFYNNGKNGRQTDIAGLHIGSRSKAIICSVCKYDPRLES